MIDAEQVVLLFDQRSQFRGREINRMLDTQRMYGGDILIPLPELDEREQPSVANLLIQGVDQLAQRLSGRLPDVDFPSAKPGDPTADTRARSAREAILGWWDMNQMTKKLGRRCRYLVAYGCAPAMVKPVGTGFYDRRKMPYWHMVDPLSMLPSFTGNKDDIEPHDVIVHRRQSLAWLKDKYPMQANILYKGPGATPDKMFDLLEYNDEVETVLVVRGAPREEHARQQGDINYDGQAPFALLERTPNRIGMCLAVIPGRITLDALTGHFDHIQGMFMAQARMAAYEQIAIRQAIFPEKWVVSHPNSPGTARIVQAADGRNGVIGEIENGALTVVNAQPSPLVSQAIDRLERSQRVQASIPSDWGAESATNIRTAKRGDQVASSASDPTLGELQNVLAEALVAENERAIAWSKAMWGGRMCSFYMPRSGKTQSQDYRPNQVFENDFHYVKYSMPGVDAASIPIELGQRLGTGEISMETARQIDPLVEDPQYERDQVELEGIRHAILMGLESQAQQGSLDPHEVALIARLKRAGDRELEECIIEAQSQLQQQQSELQQAEPGAPETQPGLAQAPPPGAPPPAAGGPPPLAQLLQSLRTPANQSPAERQLTPAG